MYHYSGRAKQVSLTFEKDQLLQKAFLIALLCLLVFTSNVSTAGSQIMVTPTRIVFDGKTRTQNVTVINSGDEAGTYRILLVNKRMTTDGNIIDIEKAEPGEQFADKMIRYSPRQVTLKPGQSQVVRLSLRKPRDIKSGEYRSHMTFKALPKSAGVSINEVEKKSDSIGVKLTAIVSVTIPVIVRHGKTDVTVALDSLQVLPPTEKFPRHVLAMELQRKGSQSIYGDFTAELESNGKSTVIGQMNGVAIYTPNATRNIKLPLNLPEGVQLNGTLKVYFRTPAKRGSAILAQSLLKVSQ